jgi:hypothetical protein
MIDWNEKMNRLASLTKGSWRVFSEGYNSVSSEINPPNCVRDTYHERGMVQSYNGTHLGALPHQIDGLEPVKQVLLKETMDSVAIREDHAALPTMLDPVNACVLELSRDAPFYPAGVDIFQKRARGFEVTYISLQHPLHHG